MCSPMQTLEAAPTSALPSADGCRVSSVVAFGCVLVMIGASCFCPSVFAQTSDSRTAEDPNKSWTATSDLTTKKCESNAYH
jgi:hypothetical protein